MKTAIRRATLTALAPLLAAFAALAQAQCAPDAEYQQSEAVKRRYPDPPVRFDTPAFAAGKSGFTTHDEMMDYLEKLARPARATCWYAPRATRRKAACMPVLLFTNSGRFAPADLQRLNRPIVVLVGQLHGNEPAGGEAMLALAKSLAEGELKPLLDRITVVIMPRGESRRRALFLARHGELRRHQSRPPESGPARDQCDPAHDLRAAARRVRRRARVQRRHALDARSSTRSSRTISRWPTRRTRTSTRG